MTSASSASRGKPCSHTERGAAGSADGSGYRRRSAPPPSPPSTTTIVSESAATRQSSAGRSAAATASVSASTRGKVASTLAATAPLASAADCRCSSKPKLASEK